ncbi:MAG TPA: hypothetical protein PKG80_08365, partial [Acidobacteriota bacterium]|nr:hypothetical protein [Acidobacteriota bacterium]
MERVNDDGTTTVRIAFQVPGRKNRVFEKIGAYERGAGAVEVHELWERAVARRVERKAQAKSGTFQHSEAKNSP